MTPFWDTNFSPPCGQLAALYFSLPMRSPDLISSLALRYGSEVLSPILWNNGLALAGRLTRGNDADFADFGIMTPLDEPMVP